MNQDKAAANIGWLAANDIESTKWTELTPKSPRFLFIPRNEALAEEYESGWGIAEVFPTNSVRIVTARDKLTIQYTSDEIRFVVEDFATREIEDARNHYNLRNDVRDWQVSSAQKDIQDHPDVEKQITSIAYRPFDIRFTWYSGRSRGFIGQPGQRVMRHMLAGPNLGIASTRATEIAGGWEHIFMAKTIIQHHTVSLKEVNYLFPLYTYPTAEQHQAGLTREPNLNDEFIQALRSALDLEFVSVGSGDLQDSFGPEAVLHYIYAVLHSPEYRRRYAEFLKSDFARVPLTDNRSLFAALVELGKSLASLHLMEVEGNHAPGFPETGDNRVDRIRYGPPNNGSPGRGVHQQGPVLRRSFA